MRYLASIGEKEFSLEVSRRGPGRYSVRVDGRDLGVETRGSGPSMVLTVDGRSVEATVVRDEAGASGAAADCSYAVTIDGRAYPVDLIDPLRRARRGAGLSRAGRLDVRSVMPGRIAAVLVREGQEVKAGQGLIVVEAMKMENEIPAPKSGRVVVIAVAAGDTVKTGSVLLSVE